MLWNWIAYHARQRPNAAAVYLTGRGVGYARFATDIASTTEALRASLPAAAKLVVIDIKRPYLRWLVVAALSRLRITSTNPAAAEKVMGDAIVLDEAAETALPVVMASAAWLGAEIDQNVLAVRDPDDDFPVRMIASSGTTGIPKRVFISASTLLRRAFNMAPCYGLDLASRAATLMGPGTVGGFTVPVGVWVAGGAMVLVDDPWFNPATPEGLKPTVGLISTGHLDKLLFRLGDRAEPVSRTHFLIGGGAVAPVTLERARRTLSRRVSVIYASTETGLVAMDIRHHQPIVAQAVGAIVPRVAVEIVDDDGHVLPLQSPGQVRVRSPMAVAGYIDDPETTSKHFKDGWFYPGDIGVFGPEGELFITGRVNELLNLGGVKVAPIVIEDIALRCPGVADAGACAVRDPAGDLVVIAVTPTEGFSRETLAKALRDRFVDTRIAIDEIAVVPRNEMGKILRAELTELMQKRSLADRAGN